MATCDVWKQTHKNFQNVLSTTATATKMLTQQEVYTWYESFCKDDQSEDHLFTNGKSGSISDCLAFSSGVSDSSDGTVNSVCSSDQLNIDLVANWGDFEDESGSDDTVFDISNSDSDEEKNDDYEHFKYTYYNCIPVWEMEQQQQQQQQSQQDGYQPLEKQRIMVGNDPCTINDDDVYCVSIDQTDVVSDADRAHSISNINENYGVDGDGNSTGPNYVFSNNISFDVENDTSASILESEILDGVFIPPTSNIKNDPICNLCQTALFDADIEQNNNNNNEDFCSIYFNNVNHGVHGVSLVRPPLNHDDTYGSIVQTDTSSDADGAHRILNLNRNIDSVHSAPIVQPRLNDDDSSYGVFNNVDSASSRCETNNPCTIFQQQFENENHGAQHQHQHQHQQQPQPSKINNNKLMTNLDLNNEITLPHGFYPLKELMDTIIQFEKRFGDDVGASIPSLNKLKLIFINEKNAHYVYRPLIIDDDFDPGGEFIPLRRLLYVFEDLDIEYGDTIGVSSYGDVKIHVLEKNQRDLNSSTINTNSSSLDINKNNSDLNSLTVNNNTNRNRQFLQHYKKKRGRKKKRYKWIVKNNLQNPTSKIFDKNGSVEKDNISGNSTSINHSSNGNACFNHIYSHISNSSDCNNASTTNINMNNGRCNASNDILNDNNIFCTVTARAPPYDPDMIK